jgi:ABC-2 type transport system permease protein
MIRAAWSFARRDWTKYLRSPRLIAASLMLPLAQLAMMSYTIGGRQRDLPVALVDLDRGPEALKLRQKLLAIEAGPHTFFIKLEGTIEEATNAARNGVVIGTILIPQDYSRGAALTLIVDNTDLFSILALRDSLRLLAPDTSNLRFVEMFPYTEWMQYLAPSCLVTALYFACLLGGGLILLDDRAAKIHEAYLATPVTRGQMLAGMVTSGALMSMFTGSIVTTVAVFAAGLSGRPSAAGLAGLFAMLVAASLAVAGLTTVLAIRVENPLIARGGLVVLNLILLFPSGAIYPPAGFPDWVRWIARFDPFTYVVHGFRAVLLKSSGPEVLLPDIGALMLFAVVTVAVSWLLFPRRL